MPFPLAHPAAALPFRRFCPRYLSFSALMIGSIVPDVAYSIDDLNKFSHTLQLLFGSAVNDLQYVREAWDWDDFSHTLPGSICFCLPVGILLLLIFTGLRTAMASILPNPHRNALLELCEKRSHPTWISYALSLLIGIWLHILWDCFTNGDRWLGQQFSFLNFAIIQYGSVQIETSRLFWWASSIGGMLALLIAYWKFIRRQKAPLLAFDQSNLKYYLLWAAMIILSAIIATPLTLQFIDPTLSIHEFLGFSHRFAGYFLTCLCISLTFVSVYLKLRQQR